MNTDCSEGNAPHARLSRDILAALLNDLARFYGEAVPAFRFSMVESDHKGIDIDRLPKADCLILMWRSVFRFGQSNVVRPEFVANSDFPLIWISDNEDRVLLFKGRLSTGAMVYDGANGATETVSADTVERGKLLSFRLNTNADQVKASRSATDWFIYAMKKRKRVFIEGVLASFVISALALFSALYTMQVYDRVVPTKGFSTLWVLTGGVLLAIFFEFMMKQARARIVDRASKQIDIELSGVFFGKAMDIRMDSRPATVGTFSAQIRHFESVRSFLTASTLFVLADAPFALFFIGVIALLAGPVALVPMSMIIVSLGVGLLATRNLKNLVGKNMEESNRKTGLLIEAIDGAESIKACGADWKVKDRYLSLTRSIASNELEIKNLSTRATSLTQSVQQLNYVGLIAAGAYAIVNGHLTMGGLIACSIIAGRALGPIAQLPGLISQWSNAKVSLDVLDKIMAMPEDRDPDVRLMIPGECKGHLQIENLTYSYKEGHSVLDVGALSFRPGEKVAVVGPVGSGKSTLIKVLSGLYRPRQGRVCLDGFELTTLHSAFVREHIGYLPQDVRLFNGTLRENLTLGLPAPGDGRILEVAGLTGLDTVIANHPEGLECMITEGGRGLSGGQRQLVGLTRLLLFKPRILLLDEPTASMDPQLEARVIKHLFEEISPDSVLVVVTHKPGILPYVDRIIAVDKSRIVLDDNREKVMALMRKSPVTMPARPMADAG